MFERFDCDLLLPRLGQQIFRTIITLAFILVATASTQSQEAAAGSSTVTIVHPFAPGGVGYDLGQVIGDRFRRLFNIPVVVEAKPGANTVLGVTSVVKSKPDGQTLLINSASITAIAGAIYKAQPYNPTTDLVPVAFVAQVPLVLVVSAGLPVKSLDDLVQLARTTAKGLSYASTGVGSGQHLSTEFLRRELRAHRGGRRAHRADVHRRPQRDVADRSWQGQTDCPDDGGAARRVSRRPDLCRGRPARLRCRSPICDLCRGQYAGRDRCPAELEYPRRDRRPGGPRAIQ
jgi:hypothetical protein